ncbi:MAG: sialate O-acetylesterase [Candidatus Hydrogenedentes bacterium]|nr:sialate O-acetylesterase [Candidatus Hydrogenedentota bacterium]
MAAVSVPSVIGSHAVLQQGKPIPIWGKATPGEEIAVTFNGKTFKATTGADGKWLVKLPKAKAGGPYDLSIAGKDNTLKFDDVLVGEVWVASGQSNMQMAVNGTNNAKAEIASAKFPNIRLFSVKRTVATQPQDNCEAAWTACTPESVPDFSAVAFYFGREVHKALNVPVGLIHTSWGGTPAESWTSRAMLESAPELKDIVVKWDKTLADYPAAKTAYDAAMVEWQKTADKAKADGQPEPKKPGAPAGPDSPWLASGLYNAMIAPLVPYAIQGAIWYQGESNAGRAYQYRKLFPAMIEDWRKAWGEGPFQFYFVQLANFTKRLPDPGDSDWAELREAQTMTLKLPNTGMALAIDIGDADDIHPRNKQDVGKRLALNALAKAYHKDVVFSGPMYKSMQVKGNKALLSFDHADGGLVAKNGTLKSFAVAGDDKKFVWADAAIEGKTVVVSSSKVPKPVAVRYGWAHNPECNFYNGAGLPASPFRTDDWPGITAGKN